jgi:hypothetical protein
VLQGCYKGGFAQVTDEVKGSEALLAVMKKTGKKTLAAQLQKLVQEMKAKKDEPAGE